ncbi:metallophosphoesterase family protein [Burkholderia ubonensis]|uniref:metallophosphoesterase family protein n=2 Tax=Burkholderia ubonensis TaxID=101571 RepID=UPI0009B3BBB9|nr:metallophosphoesterase [Burkholderia ubonensis]
MKIMHISDLHFHESVDGNARKYRHSLACLKGIERLLDEHSPTHLVVTGDITNIGDKLSLERAYQWIHDQIYSDGEYYGLRADKRELIPLIVPGNHDAFNAPTTGSELKRWQSSLSNFYSVFHRYQWKDAQNGVMYRWQQDGTVSVLFCSVDTCYLGDPETERLGNTLSLDRVAKGRLSRRQSASILSLFDKGMSGELEDPNGMTISSGEFLSALKILVMHHYLFEPADSRAEPLLQMSQKRTVFQNLAMSDFDVLLCGHKHIADIHVSTYSDNFDRRGQVRFAFNYLRRILGIKALPLGADEDGRKLNKALRLVIGLLAFTKGKGKPLDDASTREIIGILERSLSNPLVLKEELFRHLTTQDESGQAGLFDEAEMHELYSKIKDRFDRNDRRNLNDAANRLRGIISHLSGRPFAHIMSASSAKSSESGTRHRAVNIYEVFNSEESAAYLFQTTRYSWDQESHSFAKPLQQSITFPRTRGLHM